ncbi:Spermidine/putrescine import ATP-binding protein PotA [Saliniradius amylolyticus]|uniref:Spermidine/putrescine import ATP-binding protein PotA n=1 Tax=Saliniradius amylolyticus TaxID=2183582 RepID=A0A2S2E5Y5_9ALTE|nr:ATP-binding cassette domain-containing protein [Saliniradius amylolyticus]AWL13009.1 Spermidine/putrescine import ATP-binding protein PotA [Saliniradius amylolyticus]
MLSIEGMVLKLPGGTLTIPDTQVDAGELLVITGASGIGKSSILHWLLGDTPAYAQCFGRCILNGENITRLPIEQRHMGLLMQEVGLFPHLSVLDNIAFALPPAIKGRKLRRRQALEQLRSIGLEGVVHRYPEQLSGGERSRVGLVRALANQPKAMLLDEPFSALDPATRATIRQWSYQQLRQAKIPTVMVSHDPEDRPAEALHLDLNQHYQPGDAQ